MFREYKKETKMRIVVDSCNDAPYWQMKGYKTTEEEPIAELYGDILNTAPVNEFFTGDAVTLNLNTDRSVREAYYLNNVVQEYHFTIK